MKITVNKSSVLVFSAIAMILLLSVSSSESSFAYSGAFAGHNVKTFTPLNKSKPVHKVSFTFSCDSGNFQSVSFRIYQLNIRNGFDKTINLDSGNPRVTLSLPDGGYIVSASGNIMTSGGSILAEAQSVLAVTGKDKSFNIKLIPLEGMA
jgi:hypothetical protein